MNEFNKWSLGLTNWWVKWLFWSEYVFESSILMKSSSRNLWLQACWYKKCFLLLLLIFDVSLTKWITKIYVLYSLERKILLLQHLVYENNRWSIIVGKKALWSHFAKNTLTSLGTAKIIPVTFNKLWTEKKVFFPKFIHFSFLTVP